MIEIGLKLFYELISLATVDAINPCELAVMGMVLASILLYNPKNRKNVLYSGLTFTLAVFVGYFIYGIIISNFLKYFISDIYNLWIFRGFGIIAIALGLLNIKDYLYYSPGTIGTEMPLSFRPRVKEMIKKITGPWGAFIIGLLVTIFLLPCTMGPYFIFSGIIKDASFMTLCLLLLFYNLIFIIPMIIVTLLIYLGASSVEKVSGWKEKNIKKLHLAEGIILIVLGIAMITGLI